MGSPSNDPKQHPDMPLECVGCDYDWIEDCSGIGCRLLHVLSEGDDEDEHLISKGRDTMVRVKCWFCKCSFPVRVPEHPEHAGQQEYSVVGNPIGSKTRGIVYADVVAAWPDAMGIYHIPPGSRHFAEAIPPAFSEYLVNQFIEYQKSTGEK